MMSEVVKAEYFLSEVVGEVAEEDYFARSSKVLDNFKINDPTGREQFQGFMPLDESFRVIFSVSRFHSRLKPCCPHIYRWLNPDIWI